MKMFAPLITCAMLVGISSADYLHLMQRRVGLTEEAPKLESFQTGGNCEGVDCDLSQQMSVVARTEMGEMGSVDIDDEVMEEVEFEEFLLHHKAGVQKRMKTVKEVKARKNVSAEMHVYPPVGENFVKWSLCNASFHSNLGGKGPDGGEEAIRYFKVANVVDAEGVPKELDLVVETIGQYKAKNVAGNGIFKDTCFGQVNVKSRPDATNSVTLHFNWYLHNTTIPVMVSKSYFTLYDVDGSPTSSEAATFYNRVHRVYTSDNSSLQQEGELESGLTFSANGLIGNIPMPEDPENLTDQQKDRAVTVLYVLKSQFRLTFSVTGGKGGRNFAFSGHSVLASKTPVARVHTQAHDCSEEGTCSIYEDPHIRVFDGAQISLLATKRRVLADYGSGDMWLVKSSDISIQGRYLPDPDLQEKNLFVRKVAVGGPFLNGSTLILGPLDEEIWWNGMSILHSQTSAFFAEVGNDTLFARRHTSSHLVQDMTQDNAGVDVELPLGVKITVNRFKKHVNIFIQMPPAEGGQEGLCGNFNCRASDDSLDLILSHRNPRVHPGDSLFDSLFED